jgi:hypothetical protein
MQVLHFMGILPGATHTAECHAHGPTTGSGTFNYYIFSYNGSCQYCSEFSANNTNSEQMHDTLVHLLIRIEEIPWGSKLPVNAINDWTTIQCEDALTGEGGEMS